VWNEYSNNVKHKWRGTGYLMSDSQGLDSEKVKSENLIAGSNQNDTVKAVMYRFLGIIYYLVALGSLLFGLITVTWACELTHITGGTNFAVPFFLIFIIAPALLRLGRSTLSKASLFTEEPINITTYRIDYDSGTTPICDLPIGSRAIDPTWVWNKKPVVWILVAKDHYEGLEPHVTLLAEDLIGDYTFDNSSDRADKFIAFDRNHWGACGLRPCLNSTGIHEGEGFYWAFSENFTRVVLNTTLPNKKWQNGSTYSTQDLVFIPSTTELGDTDHNSTYQIGAVYPYFQSAHGEACEKRITLPGDESEFYWTRSPGSLSGDHLCGVSSSGAFIFNGASYDILGVRPALNLKSEVMVSNIKN
jgi:hypothetical protein